MPNENLQTEINKLRVKIEHQEIGRRNLQNEIVRLENALASANNSLETIEALIALDQTALNDLYN